MTSVDGDRPDTRPDTRLDTLLQHTAVVVMAAGKSTRLGSPKPLLKVSGATLIARTLQAVAGLAAKHTLVVVGEAWAQLQAELAPFHVQVLQNPAPGRGLSSSLRLGLSAACSADARLEAVLFTLCDQPYIDAELLRNLSRGLARGYPMAASSYAGLLGVPAAFARETFQELHSLEGDQGARALLRRDPARTLAVPFEAGVIDIDCVQDLLRLK